MPCEDSLWKDIFIPNEHFRSCYLCTSRVKISSKTLDYRFPGFYDAAYPRHSHPTEKVYPLKIISHKIR